MRQVLLQIPGTPIKIFGYGLFLFFAFLASMKLAASRARKGKLDEEVVYELAFWVFLGGLAGARIFWVIEYWGVRVHSLLDVFKIWEGGIVLYGSIMGGTAAFFLYWWLRPFPLRPMLDAMAPALALGIAIGRIGCLMNGCCYGDRCDLPWGVRFPGPYVGVPGNANLEVSGSPPWALQVHLGVISRNAAYSLPVHPTQIYSTIDGLILVGLMLAYFPIRKRDGEIMALLMVTYPVTRILIEWLRNDEVAMFAGLTVSQLISVGLLVAGIVFWIWLARQPAVRHADQETEALTPVAP